MGQPNIRSTSEHPHHQLAEIAKDHGTTSSTGASFGKVAWNVGSECDRVAVQGTVGLVHYHHRIGRCHFGSACQLRLNLRIC